MCKERVGHCLCGKVSVSAKLPNNEVTACHCEICRKWIGGPMLSIHGGNDESVVFSGEEYIAIYSSSEWAERGFCKNCGTHLFYRMKTTHDYSFPIELFDNSEDVEFTTEIYIDQKSTYYSFSNDTVKLTRDGFLEQLTKE